MNLPDIFILLILIACIIALVLVLVGVFGYG